METGISTGQLYNEFDACIKAGLDLERWWEGDYDPEFMVHVLAYHNLSRLVDAHQNDAQATEMRRKSKGGKG